MKQNIIRKPKIYLYTALPSILFWIFIQIFAIYEARNDGLLILIPILFFIPFILAFIYMSLLQFNWKIEIIENKVIYRNWLRKGNVYGIDDLIVVHKNPKRKGAVKFYLYFNSKKITTITMYDENANLLCKIKNQVVNKT